MFDVALQKGIVRVIRVEARPFVYFVNPRLRESILLCLILLPVGSSSHHVTIISSWCPYYRQSVPHLVLVTQGISLSARQPRLTDCLFCRRRRPVMFFTRVFTSATRPSMLSHCCCRFDVSPTVIRRLVTEKESCDRTRLDNDVEFRVCVCGVKRALLR